MDILLGQSYFDSNTFLFILNFNSYDISRDFFVATEIFFEFENSG